MLINPIRIANDIINRFDVQDTGTHRRTRGLFLVHGSGRHANQATLKVSIRDFDRATFEARKARLETVRGGGQLSTRQRQLQHQRHLQQHQTPSAKIGAPSI